MTLNLSHEVLQQTHDKTITKSKGFWFKDLKGNPMWIEPNITKWTPKTTK